jgi:hypothetical protein
MVVAKKISKSGSSPGGLLYRLLELLNPWDLVGRNSGRPEERDT